MNMIPDFVITFITFAAALLIFMLGAFLLWLVFIYFVDRTQTQHTIRRNYPVMGRLRYVFEHLGVFMRQYFFAMDREEMPFNREQRAYVYRAAKNVDTTSSFGSTRDLKQLGSLMFANAMFPPLKNQGTDTPAMVIGPHCQQPYTPNSIFNISAMSYGSLSRVAVQALSLGAAEAGCWMNTGEGGLSPYHLQGGCDIVFQIGTANYGVRDADGRFSPQKMKEIAAKPEVKMIELKLSQGAKPGKGGILPADKVSDEIAMIRGIPANEDSISPSRHADIDSVDDLLSHIKMLKEVSGLPVGFKMVLGDYSHLDDLFSAINKMKVKDMPDFITLDSADGGTGAAPMVLFDFVGMPLKESLVILCDKRREYGLQHRVKIIASGKLINPAEAAWALAAGADFINSARGFMMALGCIQALECAKNTCPTGITTHDPKLQRGLVPADKATRVASYVKNLNKELAMIAHSCGLVHPRLFERKHVRIVAVDGRTESMEDLYPTNIGPEKQI
ncbi:MAG: FMN-binding glutamate synthase family protein [Alphaproteobacteria bacterium]